MRTTGIPNGHYIYRDNRPRRNQGGCDNEPQTSPSKALGLPRGGTPISDYVTVNKDGTITQPGIDSRMERRLLTAIGRLGPISEEGLIEVLTPRDLTWEISGWSQLPGDYYMARDYEDVQAGHELVFTDKYHVNKEENPIFDMDDFKEALETLSENNFIERKSKAWRTTEEGDVLLETILEAPCERKITVPMGGPVKVLAADSEEGKNFIRRQLDANQKVIAEGNEWTDFLCTADLLSITSEEVLGAVLDQEERQWVIPLSVRDFTPRGTLTLEGGCIGSRVRIMGQRPGRASTTLKIEDRTSRENHLISVFPDVKR